MAIFDIINQPFSWLMKVFYGWTQNYAIALLLFAILIKLVLLPFSIKQQKNSQKQARLRPKEAAIRKKYQGRSDKATQQKMQQEIMEFYQKEGHNPMGGCLPLLIQFPIIISLYSIVTKPLRWLCDLSSDTISSIFDRVKELLSSGVLNEGNLSSTVFNSINKASSVNACNQIDMITCIKTVPDQFESWISVDRLPNFNMFGSFGDLSQRPSFSPFTWLVLIPVLIFVAQYFGTKLTRKFSYQPMADQQNNSSMKIMEFTMPLLSVYLSFQLPAVVGLYWIYQNVVGVAQQFVLSKVMPLPQFTEQDYKEAERAMNVNIKKKKEKVRSLHRIDEDDELPPHELPTPEDAEQDAADPEAAEPTEQPDDKTKPDDKMKPDDAEGLQPEPAKLKDDRRPSGGKKYSKTGKNYKNK